MKLLAVQAVIAIVGTLLFFFTGGVLWWAWLIGCSVAIIVTAVVRYLTHRDEDLFDSLSKQPGEYMELGPNPLDPHGDGSLRPGDPLYDLMTQGIDDCGGEAIHAEFVDNGVWKVRRRPLNQEELEELEEDWEDE